MGTDVFGLNKFFFGWDNFFLEHVSLDDTGSIQDDRIGDFLARRKKEGEFVMSNKNITDLILTVVSSVMPHRGKQASVIFYFIDGGAR
jgi:hypothetical protein